MREVMKVIVLRGMGIKGSLLTHDIYCGIYYIRR